MLPSVATFLVPFYVSSDNHQVTDLVAVTSEVAPSNVPPSSGTDVEGVPQAHSTLPSQISHRSGAISKQTSPIGVISLLTAMYAALALQLFCHPA